MLDLDGIPASAARHRELRAIEAPRQLEGRSVGVGARGVGLSGSEEEEKKRGGGCGDDDAEAERRTSREHLSIRGRGRAPPNPKYDDEENSEMPDRYTTSTRAVKLAM